MISFLLVTTAPYLGLVNAQYGEAHHSTFAMSMLLQGLIWTKAIASAPLHIKSSDYVQSLLQIHIHNDIK
jgi:hypothetical protein